MSLKLFHICFIVICVICALGFGAWCLLVPDLPVMFTWMGSISLAGGAFLLIYGIRFIRKSKNIIV